jgi:hypothetical protein
MIWSGDWPGVGGFLVCSQLGDFRHRSLAATCDRSVEILHAGQASLRWDPAFMASWPRAPGGHRYSGCVEYSYSGRLAHRFLACHLAMGGPDGGSGRCGCATREQARCGRRLRWC